ncbi:MAG: biopolymer transporter ExbD [Paramuribaculum sp.]|nr:biopolymer transporter ExbD [Paramuribaculum sp.]
MALKRQHDMTSVFSMASMTDVIFLLLIFFMVTSTFVFPTALEINLPQSSEQTGLKPKARIYIDKESAIYISFDENEPQPMADQNQLLGFLQLIQRQNPQDVIAIYADEEVKYKKLVEILDMGAKNGLKMVLATKPAPTSAKPLQ